MNLQEISLKYRSDKGTVHSYLPVYSKILEPYRATSSHVLEVGILEGESLRMWEDYYCGGEVHGVEIHTHPLGVYDLTPMIAEGHRIHIGDATSAEFMNGLLQGELFDVVIDDASHALAHQLATYEILKHRMKPDGIYIIEDIADIDGTRHLFEQIDNKRPVSIIDLRHVKNRFDDVLVVIGGDRP